MDETDFYRIMDTLPEEAREPFSVLDSMLRFVNGMNEGDPELAAERLLPEATIVDDLPPFCWQGPRACADWLEARSAWGDDRTTLHFRHDYDMTVEGLRAQAAIVLFADDRVCEEQELPLGFSRLLTLTLCKPGPDWLIETATWATPPERTSAFGHRVTLH